MVTVITRNSWTRISTDNYHSKYEPEDEPDDNPDDISFLADDDELFGKGPNSVTKPNTTAYILSSIGYNPQTNDLYRDALVLPRGDYYDNITSDDRLESAKIAAEMNDKIIESLVKTEDDWLLKTFSENVPSPINLQKAEDAIVGTLLEHNLERYIDVQVLTISNDQFENVLASMNE